jgi:hypothetical protein
MPSPNEDDEILVSLGTKITLRTRRRLDQLKETSIYINISRVVNNALDAECDRIDRLIDHHDCDRISFAGQSLKRSEVEDMIKILRTLARDLQAQNRLNPSCPTDA